jgi:hypothetical protein
MSADTTVWVSLGHLRQHHVTGMTFGQAARFGDVNSPDERGVALFGALKETALEQRDRVAALMTSEQIAEGERLARE